MNKMWAGRFKKELNSAVNDFNSSIRVDSRMYEADIKGSIAHATMLSECGIISHDEMKSIVTTLQIICDDITSGTLLIDPNAEDIHLFVEAELTARLGDTGKKLHTARSRNDQVATDTRIFVKVEIKKIIIDISELIKVLVKLAEENTDTIMSGYTHLQRAQPITFAHYLMAYSAMFMRDITRLQDSFNRMNESPLGSGALAGTTMPIDRELSASLLGFACPTMNSLDGVSDRDYAIELSSDIAIIMMHLSRFSEEIILWCSWEFKFIELDDAYATGSSIMPQKKNPDIAELVRGKTGRTYGNLITLLTMMKSLPLAYNKDMQEDKEALFDSIDTVKECITIFASMIVTMTINKERMAEAANMGFINATDGADYLVRKGLPFRTAYKIMGSLVGYAIDNGKVLESLTLSEYKQFSELFEDDIYESIDMKTCVEKRLSLGAPSATSVNIQIDKVKRFINTL